jgi:hypothetical protein
MGTKDDLRNPGSLHITLQGISWMQSPNIWSKGEENMKKVVLAIALAATMATPAFARLSEPPRHPHAAQTQAAQRQHQGVASGPAIMFKGMPYTDPDPAIRNYLLRTYREEGTG